MAKLELRTLLDKYELINEKVRRSESDIDGLLEQIQVSNRCWPSQE